MTPEEIRAEAIDRIARAEWAEHHRAEAAMDNRAWETERPAFQDTYLRWAGRMVDALGDLIPTETVWAIAWVNQYGEHERQTASIECRADAERFGAQYKERHPHLTASLQVEHQYLTAWSPDA